jgi:LuxR family quorum-sensing transcriptional regulator LasR
MANAQPRFAPDHRELPESLHSAIHACRQTHDPANGFAAMASALDFDGFSYLLLDPGWSRLAVLKHWTTAGTQWCRRYASHGYHVLDTRITRSHGRSLPVVWDAAQERTNPRVRPFLDDAREVGICSGVAISLVDARVGRVVVGWDSRVSPVTAARHCAIQDSLGHLALLAGFAHESMFAHCRPPAFASGIADLSPRERECLALAAHGMTSADIGVKLAITERTVNFHFGNIIGKLGVLNRGEAIARAVAMNLVAIRY